MKGIWMMALFGAGIWLLFAESAPGAVPCNTCDCMSTLYWRDFDAGKTYGLRKPDPMDAKNTVAVPQAQKGWIEGKMYSSVCDLGTIA